MDVNELEIRYTVLGDAPLLKEWVSTPEMLHWFPVGEEKEIEDAINCWISFSRYSSSLTVMWKGTPVAIGTLFLMPYRKVAHLCQLKMIVDPKHQRKGIGGVLLKNMKHLAKSYFRLEKVYAEVVEGNPLISLLQQGDFKVIFQQKKFFKDQGRYFGRVVLEVDLRGKRA